MDLPTLQIQFCVILGLIYYYFYRKFRYWIDRGVPGPQPSIPFGNMWTYFTVGQATLEKQYYQEYGKVYGIFHGTTPVLTLGDPEMIKQIMVKDFRYFTDRDKVPYAGDEIWGKNLIATSGDEWRRIRKISSCAFTIGKLRGMSGIMEKCVDQLVERISQIAVIENGNFNAKEALSRFALDVITSTAFAFETTKTSGDASTDDVTMGSKDVILERALKMLDIKPVQLFGYYAFPHWLNKLFSMELVFFRKDFDYFVQVVREILKQRKQPSEVKRSDLVQLLIDASFEDGDDSNQSRKTLTENEIIAQCIIFLVAGFETTAGTIACVLYFLALNPEAQEKLRSELSERLDDLEEGGDGSYYETVMHRLPYLEAVMKETLRLIPPLPRHIRRCAVDGYEIAGLRLEKDLLIKLPIYALHHDPEYFPEPEGFIPERFLPENAGKTIPYSYSPFGEGPRNCIGMQFAQQEMRLCLAKLLRRFRFEPSEQTEVPLQFPPIDVLFVRNVFLRVEKV